MEMEVVMPKVGLTMTEGTIAQWHKAEGEQINKGELLFTFETEKSTLDYESSESGVLSKIIVPVGQTVACYAPVATIKDKIETRAKNQDGAANDARLPISPRARMRARELNVDVAQVVGTGPDGAIRERDVLSVIPAKARIQTGGEPDSRLRENDGIRATPVAQRIANELGVDLDTVVGTGPDGRITREDVERAPVTNYHLLSPIRRVTAQRMAANAQAAPHVTLHTEADATELMSARNQINAELGDKISYNALLVAICAKALREHPAVNASWEETTSHESRVTSHQSSIVVHSSIHIGLAVDTPRGLLVPVLRDCGTKPLAHVHRELTDLVARTLDGKAKPDELSGGTFTITNLGMFDIDGFTPIINLPEAAILGVGRIAKKPVVMADDKIVARQMMTLSLSFDHRVVDGAPAAKFLQRVKQLIERPFALLVA